MAQPIEVEDDGEWSNGDDDDGWGEDEGDWGEDDDVTDAPEPLIPPPSTLKRQFSFQVLTHESLDDEIAKKIAEVKEELELPDNHCLLLLRKSKWNLQKIRETYFDNPEAALLAAGVCVSPCNPDDTSSVSGETEIECGICMDDVQSNELYHIECGHRNTCRNCWINYMVDSITTKECINLTCPSYKCHVIIPKEVFHELLSSSSRFERLNRYERFRRQNFVEFSKDFGFCPGPNCDMVYSAPAGVASTIICKTCSYEFCWACKQETHFPCSCHLAEKWNVKCSSEAENIQWILARTKKCPKCGVNIEKNQGCNHMTCRKGVGGCGHEFCWLCKGDWKDHGSNTGGYYKCNVYEKNKADGLVSTEEKAQESAKNELQRYEFYWTRFDSHSKSALHARQQREHTHDKMHNLSQKYGWRLNEAQFLLDAVDEAIQCWHVLAWTYAIGYYFDSERHNPELFKTQQQDLERFCDGLQEKLDFKIDDLGENKVRQQMIGYTRTANKYRRNLVEYIDTELSF